MKPQTKDTGKGREIWVTPCCKTRHFSFPYRTDLPGSNFDHLIAKCGMCQKEFDKELLEKVVRSLNPTTFFCDRCHSSAEIEIVHAGDSKANR